MQHSPFCDSRDNHGWLDDLPEITRSKLRLVCEMYAIRIERKLGPRERLATAYGQAPIISYKRRSLKE